MSTSNARARVPAGRTSPGVPAAGTRVRELSNYRLAERVGQDELATLYQATHQTLDRPVQVAVLRRSDWVSVSRFQLAMKLGARLSHPNILPVIDAGHDPHYGDYMVTPRLDTQTLKELLQHGPLVPLVALRIFSQVGQALEFLHNQSIVHRDVQPANLLVTPQGAVYLANFSLAASGETPDFSGVYEADYRTIYSAPDLNLTSNRILPAQDLYSLGALAYHMFTGELPPVPGADLAALSLRNPALELAERVIARLLAPEPSQRYASASQAVSAMHQALRELRDEASEDMQESRWETSADWLENPLELALGEMLDQDFVQKSRARADNLHRVDSIKRLLDRWSKRGMLRRQMLGQVIQPDQIVSYNVYIYELRTHYERRAQPVTRQTIYNGSPIDPLTQPADIWTIPLPEYEPFVNTPAEQVPVPGSRHLVACPQCNRSGKLPCKPCNGTGQVTHVRKIVEADGKKRNESFEESCSACHGYGTRPCATCQGHGEMLEESIFTWERFGKIHRNEDDISGLHRLTIEALAQPVFQGQVDPHDGRWNQVGPLKETFEEAFKAGGQEARMMTAELTIRGVPVTEMDYHYHEKPHTLSLLGFENTIRGDRVLFDMERAILYAVILILGIVLIWLVSTQVMAGWV